jgi:hypothetical protein
VIKEVRVADWELMRIRELGKLTSLLRKGPKEEAAKIKQQLEMAGGRLTSSKRICPENTLFPCLGATGRWVSLYEGRWFLKR